MGILACILVSQREARSSLFEQIHDRQYKDIKCASLSDHVVSGHMYKTNWGIGHGLEDIVEAYKGPFTGQGHKGFYEILSKSCHAQLSLNLDMLGSLTIVLAHHMYSMPPYPYLATDYAWSGGSPSWRLSALCRRVERIKVGKTLVLSRSTKSFQVRELEKEKVDQKDQNDSAVAEEFAEEDALDAYAITLERIKEQ
ncbi:hypothetical protein FXO38_36640 [Capsicum annuum]|uniref:Uncharacterized protein n=1 Tax=Capsicum annuum TaxID=4072 RepID=A0A2G2YSW3_CAPAN|nr:hypothetical protein FXO37_36680 [Capsicum annuum]KAF3612743.1 hypothetical protein FXO38_36640 [Capsicum annuum]PHT72857.1 hypothetical protein T459_23642 [Capsicum annuum]